MKINILLPILMVVFTNLAQCKVLQEIVDLSWGINEETLSWPGNKQFEFISKTAGVINGKWYATNDFCIAEHAGTHFDAPYHFNRTGWKVADVPIQKLIGPGVLVDLQSDVYLNGANATLKPSHLDDWVKRNGPLPDDCILLVRFGWSRYYKNKNQYLGIDEMGQKNFPGITKEAAEWIVDSTKIIGVGVDTASTDTGESTDFDTHYTLANANIYAMENVNIVYNLPARDFMLIILPMKIDEGTGAPVRIIALPSALAGRYPTAEYYVMSSTAIPWYGHGSVILSTLLLLAIYIIDCTGI